MLLNMVRIKVYDNNAGTLILQLYIVVVIMGKHNCM